MGGLLQVWLANFNDDLVHYRMKLSKFATDRFDGSDEFFLPFSKCSETSSLFVPSKLISKDGDVAIKLSEECDDKIAEKERQHLVDLYETAGKVFNQMIRERLYISEKYSSYLLWSFLIYGGIDGMLSSPMVRLEDLELAIREMDMEYTGSVKAMKLSPDYSKEYLFEEFLIPYVLEPRLEALNAIKRGFDIFPISPMLQLFTKDQLKANFFGYDLVLPSVLEKLLDFTPTETSPEPTDDFISVFKDAIRNMQIDGFDDEGHPYNDTIDFIEYVSGTRVAGVATSLRVHVMEVKDQEKDAYPSYPLPKASTCFSQIYIPYVPGDAWTSQNVLKNLRKGFPWIQSGFDDKFFIIDNTENNNSSNNIDRINPSNSSNNISILNRSATESPNISIEDVDNFEYNDDNY